ncbi:MAG: xanthine dehydrogenase family protein molybdopterin-binding subunit [Actinomycetota bacterium]|nr:xanthine dehydrogenase family protein molybdopterin-binding subunit [Actinomycetota bacterium]
MAGGAPIASSVDSWAPETRAVGSSMLRKEDLRLLTGTGRFVDDLNHPRALRASILRSQSAHARIRSLDADRARAHAGVVDVVTAADLPPGVGRIPMRMYSRPGMERLLQPILAHDVVRYVGEPVAVVVSESRYQAEDALELIDVRYEPLEPVLDAAFAITAESPLLHAGAATNVAAEWITGYGDLESAFATADVVVAERLSCQRHAAVPLEPRGLCAELDPDSGRLTVWGAAKVVHTNRRILSRLLGWEVERIRFIELDVGGGFGGRGEFYPEDFLIPFCAIRLGRAVAWAEDRSENLRALNHSREQRHEVAVALQADGTLLALRDSFLLDTGAYVRTHGSVVPSMTAALLPGPYRWKAYMCEVRQVLTNKTPAGTYRAPGRYEANFVRERILDVAARRIGLDPLELRRRNLIPSSSMPYAIGTEADGHALVLDSGDYGLLIDKGISHFDHARMRRWRAAEAGPRRCRGIGAALFVEKSGIARWEYARVGISAAGRVRAHVGSASVGQGVETVLAQICADAVGVPFELVDVVHGDTDDVPIGIGSFGSRATSLGGAAVMQAAAALRERLFRLASEQLEAATDDLAIVGGAVVVRGSPGARVPLQALLANGSWLEEEAVFDSEHMSFPYGLHLVALEIDLDTGAVEIDRYAIAYDVGLAVNPQLVEGQVVGGAAQGIGGALLEELAYDENGQLASGSLIDYLLPTAGDVPPVDVLITQDAPTPLTPLGAKGAGEGGTAAAGAAIANAVSDALGIEVTALPLAPARMLELASRDAAPNLNVPCTKEER